MLFFRLPTHQRSSLAMHISGKHVTSMKRRPLTRTFQVFRTWIHNFLNVPRYISPFFYTARLILRLGVY